MYFAFSFLPAVRTLFPGLIFSPFYFCISLKKIATFADSMHPIYPLVPPVLSYGPTPTAAQYSNSRETRIPRDSSSKREKRNLNQTGVNHPHSLTQKIAYQHEPAFPELSNRALSFTPAHAAYSPPSHPTIGLKINFQLFSFASHHHHHHASIQVGTCAETETDCLRTKKSVQLAQPCLFPNVITEGNPTGA